MIINPIMPVWLMIIISIALIVVTIYNKNILKIKKDQIDNKENMRQKRVLKDYYINVIIKILIIMFVFIINLRIMILNEDVQEVTTSNDLSVLFVIDTSVSMRALDYDGNNERLIRSSERLYIHC